MDLNELTYKIRGVIFTVHNELGPGLLESVYEAAIMHEFKLQGIQALSQVGLPVYYKGQLLDLGFRIDILVEDTVIIEVKSVETLRDVHKKIALAYVKLSKKKLGILVNFNEVKLIDKESLIRIIN